MSLKEVTMYTVICDRCGKDQGKDNEIRAWDYPGFAVREALDGFWIEHKGKHYCPACTEWDEDKGKYTPKQEASCQES